VRVALVCPYDWSAPGGVRVHVEGLARALAGRGHHVEVIAPGVDRDAIATGAGTVPVHGVGRVLRVPYRGTVAPIAPSPAAIPTIRRILGRLDPDLVHVHEPFTPSTAAWATLASRVPVVATFHSSLDRSRLLELGAPILAPVRGRISRAVAVSEAAASFVGGAFPSLEVTVVPNGVETRVFAEAEPIDALPDAAPPDAKVIVWTHRLDPQKGFPDALEAFAIVASALPDTVFVVAGDGSDRGALARLSPPARSRVRMLGAVGHDRVAGLLRGGEVALCAATGQESFGLVLVEAMAAGVPVVATDIAGYREVATDEVNALLVPPGRPDLLAAALQRILTDPSLAARLADGGRTRARSFDWAEVAGRLEDVYDRARRRGPASLR
jgi:phosphatidylinositol alpha-mannosyltransferase